MSSVSGHSVTPSGQGGSSAEQQNAPSRSGGTLHAIASKLLFVRRLLALLLVTMFLPPALPAQSDLSSISGTITDPSGAVVAGAAVTLRNESTGVIRATTTNGSGFYTISSLAPGRYSITVESPSFQKLVRTGNNLDPAIPTTANLGLALAGTAQQVQVAAEETTLQADSSTLGRVITSNQADNLPLNGRNPIYLALTKAGITSTSSNVSTFNFSTGLGSLNINGARERGNLLTYDGAVAVRVRASGDSVGTPDLDAVQEVQILTTNYPAEYGRSTGGQVRIITKSGGNQFHGSIYEYLRNPVLDANSWVRNHNTNNNNPLYPKALKQNFVAPYTFNQFGFNVNGPLYIPRVLPKGKVFFLYSEAFVHYPQTSTATFTVPNPAFQTGDFSSIATHIKDPASTLACDPKAGGPGCFPGNIIPKGRLSANGVALLSVYPAPTPGFQVGNLNELETGKYPATQQIDSGNLDIVPNDKNSIRFRLIHFVYHENNPFAATFNTVPRIYDRPNQTGSIDWVFTPSGKLINELLVTGSHDAARLSIDTSSGLYNRAKYGINYPFLFPDGKDLPSKIPTVQFDSSAVSTMDGSAYPSHSQGQIFDISDTVTRLFGNHTIKAGVLFERSGENDRDQIAFQNSLSGQTNNQNGKFEFNSSRPGGTGLDTADAALGLFSSYAEVGPRAETPYRGNMYEFFAQDSFKATPKLHLEYGLRYSIIQPYYSLWNNMGTFDPAFYNPATAVTVDPKTGNPIAGSGDPLNGTVLFGNGFTDSAKSHVPAAAAGLYSNLFHNLPRGYINVQHITFQPRLGIAYELNNKTVLRTGFGRYMNRQGVSDGVFAGGIPPLQQVAGIANGNVDNPGGVANGSFPTLSGRIDRGSPQPEAYVWNVSVERQLGFDTVAEVSYVGRRALHEQFQSNINQPQPGTVQANPGININALRPYRGYGNITLVKQGDGAAYQGLQIDVNHRFSKGLGFGAAYTFAKSEDCGSFQKNFAPNYYDPKAICGYADYDVRHVLVLNAEYQLPTLRGHNLLVRESLGGWQITQADQFQTGSPFSVASGTDYAGVGVGGGAQMLQIVPGANLGGNRKFSTGSDSNFFYNPAAFAAPTAGTFTTQRNRNVLRNPGQQNWNAGLLKRFPTVEGQDLIFRFEAFNFINHPNLAAVDANPTSSTFGRVVSKTGQRQMQVSLRYTF
jgi:hypothetical protein